VIGVDQDSDAIAETSERLAPAIQKGRLSIVQGNFANLPVLLDTLNISAIDGILLDLGVSSHQFDAGHRGFSHRLNGPLDMRMDVQMSESAGDLLARLDEFELRRILRKYGEEPRARAIAHAMLADGPPSTTAELAAIIDRVVSGPQRSKSLARVFQALRIAVNDEVEVLLQVLRDATDLVKPGGRIAVIAYHSLEDRPVKRFLRYGNLKGEPVRDVMGNLIAPWRPINRRPIAADEEEVQRNPRSRSARLRLAERQPLP
jgi:16S rRNA (cytosine1402-N4)-methyltransferase